MPAKFRSVLARAAAVLTHPRRRLATLALAATVVVASSSAVAVGAPRTHHGAAKPTIVLVHGAFADSSSWHDVALGLRRAGYPVLVVGNPLRDLASDTAYVRSVVASIDGPVVLVGHSYAGMITSQVAAQQPNVKALVYVAAFIPRPGESTNSLNTMFPGSQLIPENLITRATPSATDVYIKPERFGFVYAGGLSSTDVESAALEQRPITAEALAGAATLAAPASIPKWEVVALQDHAVPTKVQQFMAKRAGARVVTANTGHDVPAADPTTVRRTVITAAAAVS